MLLYPAIDLKGGRVVRLEQGRADRETVYYGDPAEPALQWKKAGTQWIHMVDLDGAFTGVPHPANGAAIRRVLELGVKVQLGGGMRDEFAIAKAFEQGVTRVVLGTKAAQSPDFVAEMVKKYGERIAVGIDAKDGRVAIKGWVETSDYSALDLAQKMESLGVRTIIYTDISRDGLLTGPNFQAQEEMLKHCLCHIIASGGVARIEDIKQFAEMARKYPNLDGVITGKAIYEDRLSVVDALALCD